MITLAIVVEGDTEEEFVKAVLVPHLREKGLYLRPINLGGNVHIESVALNMANASLEYGYVTSFVDFYGFVKKGSMTVSKLERVINDAVEAKIRNRTGGNRSKQRVFAYVQRHEFESLLFSEVKAFSREIPLPETSMEMLVSARSEFKTPEDINDSRQTAPSKRIIAIIPKYQKRVNGTRIALAIGLDKIRAECPRFDRWVRKLEGLGNL